MSLGLLDPSVVLADPGLDERVPCRSQDPELFFAESPSSIEHAKSVCRCCPAREQCLSGALERREPYGVWGGELLIRGVVVPHKRPRGRPRRVDVASRTSTTATKGGSRCHS